MKKAIFTFYLLIIIHPYASAEDLKIISREEWWANEEYTNIKSLYWTDILVKREQKRVANINKVYSEAELIKQERDRVLARNRNAYINDNYASRFATNWIEYYHDGKKLAWPVKKSKSIDGLIIHHTYSEYESSLEWVNNILKYHGINREWWDIGYNFIIGYSWEIYEGRLGWDYAIWAHATWNNYSTLWISVLWNYDERQLNVLQRKSLERLISHLIYKYDISMLKTIPLHKTCTDCAHGLITEEFYPIAGHRDWGHTSCPWENLYKIIPELNAKFKSEQIKNNKMFFKLTSILENFETVKLQRLDKKIQLLSEKVSSEKDKYILKKFSEILEKELLKR